MLQYASDDCTDLFVVQKHLVQKLLQTVLRHDRTDALLREVQV